MSKLELQEAIRGRRSIRSFERRPVPKELLHRLIESAIWAPTASNAQAWRFVVVTDPELVGKITTVSPGVIGDPPVIIAVCQDMDVARARWGEQKAEVLACMDASMATQNLILAAHEAGLGTCVVASFHGKSLQRILKLPVTFQPQLLVSVGWPAETPSAPARRKEGVLFFEVYSERE